MNLKTDPEPKYKEYLTFKIKYSARDIAIAKIIIIATLSILFGQYFVTQARKEYRRGQEITQEEYIEHFTQYKADLLSSRTYTNNYPLAIFIFFIVLGFIFGAYELISLAIGLAIGKIVTHNSGYERQE
ncbi:MAG: hypothetical protein J7647_25425 [Cyanobacteria bacterium SBLK]|nr:hypothetical protein [Cyanobacteria bacterium SBLK]